MKITLLLMIWVLLIVQGVSYAHEGEMHHHHDDAQMAKLHEIMPRYAKAQAAINEALGKGDTVTVGKETGYILSTTSDLKKSKPHKKLDKIEEFKSIGRHFEADIRATAEQAKKGDIKAAKSSFAKAQQQCAACHEKFRD